MKDTVEIHKNSLSSRTLIYTSNYHETVGFGKKHIHYLVTHRNLSHLFFLRSPFIYSKMHTIVENRE